MDWQEGARGVGITSKGSGIRTISQQHLKLGDNGSSNSKGKLYQTQYSLSSQLSISHANRITFSEVKILQSLTLLWKLKEGGSTTMRVNKEKARGGGHSRAGGPGGSQGWWRECPDDFLGSRLRWWPIGIAARSQGPPGDLFLKFWTYGDENDSSVRELGID